jgi:hypothetical protein
METHLVRICSQVADVYIVIPIDPANNMDDFPRRGAYIPIGFLDKLDHGAGSVFTIATDLNRIENLENIEVNSTHPFRFGSQHTQEKWLNLFPGG